jgi:hypothetical protein
MNRQQVEALKAMAALMEPNCRAVLEDAIMWIEDIPTTADGFPVLYGTDLYFWDRYAHKNVWEGTYTGQVVRAEVDPDNNKKARFRDRDGFDVACFSECYSTYEACEQANTGKGTTEGDQPATASDKHKER